MPSPCTDDVAAAVFSSSPSHLRRDEEDDDEEDDEDDVEERRPTGLGEEGDELCHNFMSAYIPLQCKHLSPFTKRGPRGWECGDFFNTSEG